MFSDHTVGKLSAAAYCFVREVSQETGVLIGIITSDCGGTPVEPWMSPTAFRQFPNDQKAWVESLDMKSGEWENGVEPNNQAIGQLVERVRHVPSSVTAVRLRWLLVWELRMNLEHES